MLGVRRNRGTRYFQINNFTMSDIERRLRGIWLCVTEERRYYGYADFRVWYTPRLKNVLLSYHIFFLEKTRKVYWTIHTDSVPEKIGCCHEVLGQRPNQVEVDFNIIREEVD